MQYVITLSAEPSDTERFAQMIESEDASAVVDHAPGGQALRLSTCLSQRELHALAAVAGMPIGTDAIEQMPSECCGGCGG